MTLAMPEPFLIGGTLHGKIKRFLHSDYAIIIFLILILTVMITATILDVISHLPEILSFTSPYATPLGVWPISGSYR